MRLGTCYFPEHWPESDWDRHIQLMKQAGLDTVRMGEFAWSRIEKAPGQFDFDWMDRTLDAMHEAGLEVTLCTPTATPPKWLMDQYPSIYAVGPDGRRRGFGSRRHYRFASELYREQAARITEIVAKRWGQHPAVTAWQTDNEYGCHDTTFSYSMDDLESFKHWCEDRYRTPENLNRAWGNAFWSMEITDFDQLWLPVGSVTEMNPAAQLAYRRFGSQMVREFNQIQVELLKQHSPGRLLAHNYMGFFTEFDHREVAQDLDVASWDSYPLGFTDLFIPSDEQRQRYMRTGHPDIAAFHHDLYRSMGRLWVMEQQPGPVNWANNNPAPLDSMMHYWLWEGWAHGADVMSFFRWRQAPWAQEQMHAGMLRPDGQPDLAFYAAQQAATERDLLADRDWEIRQAPVALLVDYPSLWTTEIQPQGSLWNPIHECFRWYSALRRLGLDIDIKGHGDDLSGYELVVSPASTLLRPSHLETLTGRLIMGPRTASKTDELSIPSVLPMGDLMPLKVIRAGSYGPLWQQSTLDPSIKLMGWQETIETELKPLLLDSNEQGVWYRAGNRDYLAACLTDGSLTHWLARHCSELNVPTIRMKQGERTRTRGKQRFRGYCGDAEVSTKDLLGKTRLIKGEFGIESR